jgi:hypothetical protein
MVIADSIVVRGLCGNRDVTILPETDITTAIAFSDSLVQTKTSKIDWDVTDPAYSTVKQASEFFAASSLLSRYQDAEKDAEEQWQRGDYLIQSVVDNLATATGGEDPTDIVNIESGEYLTFPLNPNVPYRRLGGRGGSTSNYEGMEGLFRLY